MRVVLASLLLFACGGAPQREEAAPPLIVPPLAASPDAGASTPSRAPVQVASPLAVPARDPRAAMRSPRSPAELRTEIARLEQDGTASGLHTLGETYCELARVEPGGDAHVRAIQALTEVVSKHPSYAQMDEVLYDLALEYEIGGDKMNARRSLYELIKRLPSSQYIPYAYFAFGEMFFEEGAKDPSKYALAEQAYKEVLKYPQSPIHNEAQSRLDEIKKR